MQSYVPSTATKSPQRKLQEGQAIVLIGLLILVLFGMLGLAIDSGRSYVDRRDQQAAVDAAALAAGDWYENYSDLNGSTVPQSVQVYENDLRIYGGFSQTGHSYRTVGVNASLPEDTYTYGGPVGYTLKIVATNTQFNGYQFVYTTSHAFPLAFMQVFGGPSTVTIGATATSIVGNQRQTPALLTLSTGPCATHLQGSGSLTVLGDTYTNGQACVDANLHEAGNCYGVDPTSNCNSAQYYCYNSSPGFIPYDPNSNGGSCRPGDTIGQPVVPAPSLPDPGYQSPSWPYYSGGGVYEDRGTYTEMTPGIYNNFSVNGNGCYFLDPGIYTWNGGYSSHGSLVSNELKAPDEELWTAPGTIAQTTVNTFWAAGGCAGSFTVTSVPVAGANAMKHQGGTGVWGIELTSDRYDQFLDPTIVPDPCLASPGCRRESAPSACHAVSTSDPLLGGPQGIDINVTKNSPGAQYYLAYINPNGCDPLLNGGPNAFSFAGRFLAPGFAGASPPAIAVGPPWNGTLVNGVNGWPCAEAGVSLCSIAYNNLSPTIQCFAQSRSQLCQPPDDETAPQCFSSCPPSPSVPQDNNIMSLQYAPYTGGDVANENYCQQTPLFPAGSQIAPCATAKITPGAVQFYFTGNNCMDQNGNGYTHVFSGEQYNWIVIYQVPGTPLTCAVNKLNGNALTQYIGTIYSPSSYWDILGTDLSPLAGQVICYTATVTGTGNAGIDFNPNFAPAPPAARLIN
jgi:Flp pilus assembly protein TadG